ncbi:MAG: hypothetical protein WD795_07040 [Woeseia sp.]
MTTFLTESANCAVADHSSALDGCLHYHIPCLGYAVLSVSGATGDERLFAVPVRALTVATDGRQFMLNADRQMLKNAPGFDRHHWPDTADPHRRSGIHSYYSF